MPERDFELPLIESDPSLIDTPDWQAEAAALIPEELNADGEAMIDDNFSLESDSFEQADHRPTLPIGTYDSPGLAPGNASYTAGGRSTGFDNGPVFIPQGNPMLNLVKGFSFSANLTSVYSSNVTNGTGQGSPETSDLILGLGGTVSYLSTGRDFTFGGNYSGSYDQYMDDSDFSGFNQSAGLVANYNGGKISASLSGGLSFGRGANRDYANAGNVIDQTIISTNFSARYSHSQKTSLTMNTGYSYTTASGNSNDTSSFNLGLAALWRYSPLTEFGPGIRYTANFGGGSNDRTSIGPTLNLNYKLSTKVSLSSRVGLDFASTSGGGSSETSPSASIRVNYNASSLWGMNLSLNKDAQADGSVNGAFNDVTALRLGYHRQIRKANVNLGFAYETTSTENSSTIPGGGRPDRDYVTFDASLGMPVFYSTSYASIFIKYNDQSAGATESYDSTQLGLSLSRSF